ncbi:hypothetical protein EVAR_86062_1 [Eumeta japonica]|uniref:Uncharacterized protein n=1 Tax=Eumeta variegata TaxID=151549 RepID=A0A4C1UJQ8_EUMVA|nr:hypothetical protein EVAR_86062_1 [Eumeta japonica]
MSCPAIGIELSRTGLMKPMRRHHYRQYRQGVRGFLLRASAFCDNFCLAQLGSTPQFRPRLRGATPRAGAPARRVYGSSEAIDNFVTQRNVIDGKNSWGGSGKLTFAARGAGRAGAGASWFLSRCFCPLMVFGLPSEALLGGGPDRLIGIEPFDCQ